MDGVPAFFEEGGKRWFRTGDIGEFDLKGNILAYCSYNSKYLESGVPLINEINGTFSDR